MFILLEMQTTNGKTSLVPTKTFTEKHPAESAFHTALAAAAVSKVTVHSVILLDEHGSTLRREYYEHMPEAEE